VKEDNWNKNARSRYLQMISGIDITYQDVFLPLWKEFLTTIPKFNTNSLLEIGSGPGVFTKEIAPFFKEVVCLEPSLEMANLARENNKLNSELVVHEVPIELYRTQTKFSACIAHMVLHSVLDIKLVFESVYKVLKNKGIFAFTLPHPCFYHIYKNEEFNNFNYNERQEFEIDFKITLDLDPHPGKITYFHRSLSIYLNYLINSKFNIIKFEEIVPSEETMRKYPEKWEYPRYIFIVVTK
jgi:SAM-dependent methyltransferase